MRGRRSLFSLLALVPLMAFPCVAQAQIVPLQGFGATPSLTLDPDGLPHIESTRAPGHLNWNLGAAVQLLERPLATRLPDGTRTGLIGHQLWTNVILQLGLGSRVGIAFDLPVMFSQNANLAPFGMPNNAVVGFGDVRAVFRITSRPEATARPSGPPPSNNASALAQLTPTTMENAFVGEGPGWAVNMSVSAPTGDPRSLTGQGAWIVHPQFTGDFRLFGLVVAGQIGYRARIDRYWPRQGFDCDGLDGTMGNVACMTSVPLRDMFTWGIGLRVPRGLLRNVASLFFETMGTMDARAPGTANTALVQMGGGAQRAFGDVTLTLGFYGGLTDVPGNPRFRTIAMVQWAPRVHDEDGDGLRDNTGEDQCVGLAEDRDGYQDGDGCPEDNDNDEVPDAEDRCPTVDEDMDGFQDEDGCPDPDNDNDGVIDTNDRCRDEAMGAHPDPERPGCPNTDMDGDGVPNDEDQCADTAPGPNPDPARRGCPAPDGDHDGVPDASDLCPAEPAGDGATAAMRGCPDPDRDHDGVPDTSDRCADSAETINGFEDSDGCAEATPPRTARARVRVVGASATSPGRVELLEAVQFTATDAVDPRSEPVIAQMAVAMFATARRNVRHHTVSVMMTPASVRGAAAVDAARAQRRRDAVVSALRAHGVPEWAVMPVAPMPAPARPLPAARNRGVVVDVVEESNSATVVSGSASTASPASSGASGSASAPANSATMPASGGGGSAASPASGSSAGPGR